MSIVGFRGKNHPQQVDLRGALDEVDDRGTHPDHFGPLQKRFRFNLDVAAAVHNAKCGTYYTRQQDGLDQPWAGRVWCNPPYSRLSDWVAKAWAEWDRDPLPVALDYSLPPPELIVMLLPANRTEQGWWQDHVEARRDRANSPLTVEFLRGRMRFIKAGQTEVGPNERPPFGCCLLIWERFA